MMKKYSFLILLGAVMSLPIYAKIEEQPVNVEQEKLLRQELSVGGVYQHYSGKTYRVLDVFRNSEDLTLWVAYQGLYEDTHLGTLWIRPLEMFLEKIEIKGVITPRFKKISDK